MTLQEHVKRLEALGDTPAAVEHAAAVAEMVERAVAAEPALASLLAALKPLLDLEARAGDQAQRNGLLCPTGRAKARRAAQILRLVTSAQVA